VKWVACAQTWASGRLRADSKLQADAPALGDPAVDVRLGLAEQLIERADTVALECSGHPDPDEDLPRGPEDQNSLGQARCPRKLNGLCGRGRGSTMWAACPAGLS
jgi:hypothetical protein